MQKRTSSKINIWISNDQLARLRKVQEEIGVTVSESVRRGIDMYLKAFERPRKERTS